MNLFPKKLHIFILLSFLLVISLLGFATENPLNSSPIELLADKVEYIGDDVDKKIIATGDVIATQDNQKVTADFIEYDVNKDILLAEGQVKILQRDGYIIDANKVILSDRLKFGSIYDFTVLMPDKSTLRGKFAKREEEFLTDIDKGYYTACQICSGKATIWDIKAKSATLDQEENSMTYHHAVLSFYEVPILYTPYLSHYTSKAERKSGFLRPDYGISTYLGEMIEIPYYFNIAPDRDATLNTLYTSKRGVVLEGEYRHLFADGQANSSGSITSADHYIPPTQPPGQSPLSYDVRYSLNSDVDFALSENNYAGWHAKVASDKAYRRDYNYGSEDFITSRIYNSAYQERGFYEIQALSFQNLRPYTSASEPNYMHQTPMVMPLLESKHQLHEFEDDSNLSIGVNALKIHRYVGAETNRLSIKNQWQKPLTLDSGHNFNFFSSVRNDFYYYENAPINNQNFTGNVTRTIPEAGVDWSYPLGKSFGQNNVIISPMASVILTPYTNYNENIYNEDSPSNELNDGNLFSHSKYSGIDLIQNTPRVNYGVKAASYYQNYLNTSALFGQSYQQRPQDPTTGTREERYSDYVGRLKVENQRITAFYQFTLDKDNFSNKVNMLSTTVRHQKAYVATNLIYYRNGQTVDGIKNRREIFIETGITEYNDISLSVNARRNLTSKRENPGLPTGIVSAGGRVKYLNDCITYSASVNKDFTENVNQKQNTTFLFDVTLKNLN